MLYEIRLPKDAVFNPTALAGVTVALFNCFSRGLADYPLELAVASMNGNGVSFIVRQYANVFPELEQVEAAVKPFFPEVAVDRPYKPAVKLPAKTRVMLLPRAYELRQDAVQVPITALKSDRDPLAAIVQAMGTIGPDEYMEYTVIVTGQSKWQQPLWGRFLQGMAEEMLRKNYPEKYHVIKMQEDKRLGWKRKQPLYGVLVALRMTSPDPQRFQVLSSVAAMVQHMADDLYPIFDEQFVFDFDVRNDDEFVRYDWVNVGADNLSNRDQDRMEFAMLAEELATMWHLPHVGMAHTKVRWLKTLPKDLIIDGSPNDKYCRIGFLADGEGQVAINRGDRRYHTYVTGQTGMGKSTFLQNLIDEDIQAGCGVAVLDPHGTLIADILKSQLPAERLKDILLLECGNVDYPVPLNPLRTPPGVPTEAVFNTVLWIMQSIYARQWSATRMETVFRNILQVILQDPETTPLDIQEVVVNANFRRKLLAQQSNELSRAARNWWAMFDDASKSEQRTQTQSTLSRLAAFLGSAHVERMTCHPKTIDFRTLIRDKKIVLISLKGDAIASEVDSLGAIFLAQFYLSSLSLGDLPGTSDPRFYLYVDETQRFITTSLPDMFAEARKFGLSLTLANQYIGQLDSETSEGILKNVGTKVSFACHPDEAQQTYRMYAPDIEREELPRLSMGMAAVSTRYQGTTQPAFIMKGYGPLKAAETPVNVETIRQQTREYLGMIPAAEVTKWIDARYDGDLFKKPPVEVGLTDYDPTE